VDSLQCLHSRWLHSHRQQREIAVELFLVSGNKKHGATPLADCNGVLEEQRSLAAATRKPLFSS